MSLHFTAPPIYSRNGFGEDNLFIIAVEIDDVISFGSSELILNLTSSSTRKLDKSNQSLKSSSRFLNKKQAKGFLNLGIDLFSYRKKHKANLNIILDSSYLDIGKDLLFYEASAQTNYRLKNLHLSENKYFSYVDYFKKDSYKASQSYKINSSYNKLEDFSPSSFSCYNKVFSAYKENKLGFSFLETSLSNSYVKIPYVKTSSGYNLTTSSYLNKKEKDLNFSFSVSTDLKKVSALIEKNYSKTFLSSAFFHSKNKDLIYSNYGSLSSILKNKKLEKVESLIIAFSYYSPKNFSKELSYLKSSFKNLHLIKPKRDFLYFSSFLSSEYFKKTKTLIESKLDSASELKNKNQDKSEIYSILNLLNFSVNKNKSDNKNILKDILEIKTGKQKVKSNLNISLNSLIKEKEKAYSRNNLFNVLNKFIDRKHNTGETSGFLKYSNYKGSIVLNKGSFNLGLLDFDYVPREPKKDTGSVSFSIPTQQTYPEIRYYSREPNYERYDYSQTSGMLIHEEVENEDLYFWGANHENMNWSYFDYSNREGVFDPCEFNETADRTLEPLQVTSFSNRGDNPFWYMPGILSVDSDLHTADGAPCTFISEERSRDISIDLEDGSGPLLPESFEVEGQKFAFSK